MANGIGSTGAIGSFTKGTSPPLSGVEGTGARGNVGLGGVVPLSGLAATSARGAIAVEGGEAFSALTGVSATNGRGSVAFTHEQALSGNVSYTGFGRARTFPITSQYGTGAIGTSAPTSAKELSGRQGSGALGTLTAAAIGGGILTGLEGTSAVGTAVPKGTIRLTGLEGLSDSGDLSSTSPAVTAIIGLASIGEPGVATVSFTDALLGHAGTSGIGALVPTHVPAMLTGHSATSARGNITNAKYAIRISWVASADTGVTGYYIGYGTVSHAGTTSILDYTTVVDVSGRLTTSYLISGLSSGVTYYINITSHGAGGHDAYESLPLGEISSLASPELSGMFGTAALGSPVLNSIRTPLGRSASGALGTMSATVETLSATLSGLAGVGEGGSLALDRDGGITGHASTSSAGTIEYAPGPLLSGLAGMEGLGTFGVESQTDFIGLEGTGGVGSMAFNLSEDRSDLLVGIPTSGDVGISTPEIAVELPGLGALGEFGTTGYTRGGMLELSGVTSSGRVGEFFLPKLATGEADAIFESVYVRRRR